MKFHQSEIISSRQTHIIHSIVWCAVCHDSIHCTVYDRIKARLKYTPGTARGLS